MTLNERLQQIAANLHGTMGLAVRVLRTGDEFRINDQELFPLASVFKVPLIVELLNQVEQGRLTLDQQVELQQADMALGSGVLRDLRPGARLSLWDLATLATIISDNTAADILVRLLGGGDAITATLRRLGLQQIAVRFDCKTLINLYLGLPPYGRDPETMAEAARRAQADQYDPDSLALKPTLDNNCTTPSDMLELFTLMAGRELISPAASDTMLDILLRQQLNQRIPLLLPSGTRVAHKTGTLGPSRNDAGIIYLPDGSPIIFCAFTKQTIEGAQADRAIAEAALAVYETFTK